ncbi:MAG: amidohydrolase [Rhodospirillaceae bacterium]|nr:amidohydrolase [Rhodospirillaceae bacterium]
MTAGVPRRLIIAGGTVVTGDAKDTRHDRADVVVEGDRIVAVGPDAGAAYADAAAERIDAGDAVVMPGLVNAHLHSNEGFEQGAYDNLPLEPWLLQSYPPFGFPLLEEEDYYLRTMMAALQSIRSGVTTVQDDYVHMPGTPEAQDAAIQAYVDAGLRAWVTVDLWDIGLLDCLPYAREMIPADLQREILALPPTSTAAQLDLFRRHFEKWHGREGRIRIVIAPCGAQRCSRDMLREIARLSESLDIPIHSHTLETRLQAVQARQQWGKTAIEYLDEMGLLTPRLAIVHGIWLSDRDIAMLAERECSVVHNPLSNLKLGSGVCPVRKLLDAGVNVALGTDGLATSDTADLIEAIRAASLMHKLGTHDFRAWVSAAEVFRMATRGGARSSLMEREVGSLEPGKKADIILLDRAAPGLIPLNDPVRQLAFSVTSEAVTTTIVGGRVLMRDRRILSFDEAAMRARIRESAERFRRDRVPAMRAGAARLEAPIRDLYYRAAAEASALGIGAASLGG